MKLNKQALKGVFQEMELGVGYARRGAQHVWEHPALLLWGLWPAFLQGGALILAVRLAFWEGADLLEAGLGNLYGGILPDSPNDPNNPLLQSVQELQQSAFSLLSFIAASILFVLLMLLGLLTAIFFSAPALHAMSRQVECALDSTGRTSQLEEDGFEWLAPMQRSGLGLVSWVLGQMLFLPLQLFPVFGGMLETTMGLGWSSLVMGRELMDGALSRRGLSFQQQVRVVWSQRVICGAIGLLGSLTLWIPILNVFSFAALVTGATLLVRDFSEEDLHPKPEEQPETDATDPD